MPGEYMEKLNVCCDVALYTKCAGVMVGMNKVTCMWEGPGAGGWSGLWFSACTPVCAR